MNQDTQRPKLPEVMWVVTPDRTRAGKPPMKIKPTEFSYPTESSVKPDFVMIGRKSRLPTMYSYHHCYTNLDDAKHAAEKIIDSAVESEMRRYEDTRIRLRNARRVCQEFSG